MIQSLGRELERIWWELTDAAPLPPGFTVARFATYRLVEGPSPSARAHVADRIRIPPNDAEQFLDDLQSHFGNQPYVVHTGPNTTPGNLPEMLLGRGFSSYHQAAIMALILSDWKTQIDATGTHHVDLIHMEDQFREVIPVFLDSVNKTPEERRVLEEILLQDFQAQSRDHHLVLALRDEAGYQSVIDATLTKETLVFGGAATVQAARGRGYFRILVDAALRIAVSRGAVRAMTLASSHSEGTFEAFGFLRCGKVEHFASPSAAVAAVYK